jgi:peptidoglycan/LPS O-acetylase OafA/YrhL
MEQRAKQRMRENCSRRAARIASAAAVALGVSIASASVATTIDFEGAAPGSDVASLGSPGASLTGGLVLSETFVSALLGYPAAGTWNTTPGGVNGALNTLGAEIAIDFDLAVTSLAVDVLALPDAAGARGSVLLLAFAGASLVAFDVSDPSATGDSGLPEDTLAVAGAGITRALLCAPSPNEPTSCLAPGIPTTLWIDQVRFEPVPEPSTLVLAGIALAAFAVGRRTQ